MGHRPMRTGFSLPIDGERLYRCEMQGCENCECAYSIAELREVLFVQEATPPGRMVRERKLACSSCYAKRSRAA